MTRRNSHHRGNAARTPKSPASRGSLDADPLRRRKLRPLLTIEMVGPEPDPARLPARVNRLDAATLFAAVGVPVQPRQFEREPGIAWSHASGVATALTRDVLAAARRRLERAPPIAVGKRSSAAAISHRS